MADGSAPASGISFIQGFLLGQISVCVLVGFLIKFFIFGEAPSSGSSRRSAASRRRRHTFSALAASPTHIQRQLLQQQKKGPSALRPSPPLTAAAILAKTYYNVDHHQAESVDWFNVLIAQTIAQLRTDAQQDEAVLASLSAVLNGPRKPDWLGEVRVTEVNLGDEFPIFSNCRVIPVEAAAAAYAGPNDGAGGAPGSGGRDTTASGTTAGRRETATQSTTASAAAAAAATAPAPDGTRLQARMDVDLSDTITLGIETKLLLNYPKPNSLVLPVALAVSVVRFSGTLSISFIPSPGSDPPIPATAGGATNAKPSDPTPPTTLTFGFLPDYRLELSTRSLLGGRARLQDVPKIAQVVESQLCNWFDERCVEPRFQQIVLPSLWPRKRNARGGLDPQHDGRPASSSSGLGDFGSPGHSRTRTTSSGFNTWSGGISMLEVEKLRDERLRRQRDAVLARQQAEERDAQRRRQQLDADERSRDQQSQLRRRLQRSDLLSSPGGRTDDEDEAAIETDGTGGSTVARSTGADAEFHIPGALSD